MFFFSFLWLSDFYQKIRKVGEIDSIELINSERKKIILRLTLSNIDSNIGSNLQKRDRTARDEDGFVFLAPASTSRAYASGMHRVNYTVYRIYA